MSSPKVLFIAYACAAGHGSEWGMAWNLIQEIARTQDVWIITHSDNREVMDAYLRTRTEGGRVTMCYVDLPPLLGWMRNSIYALLNVHYYLWQNEASKAALRLHSEVGFDIVQHISYCRWWMPTAASSLVDKGVKFVFGPIAGGEQVPASFRNRMPLGHKLTEWMRLAAREFWARDPALRRCIAKASVVIPSTPESTQRILELGARDVEIFPCVALGDPEHLRMAREARALKDPAQKFRIVSVGGVSHYRGIDIVLHAIKRAGLSDVEYIHACGGPQLERMQQLARSLGIEHQVIFTGETKHAENVRIASTADVYVHLTLRDNQGMTLEAQMLGIPCIVFDHNSAALMVHPESGFRIRIGDDVSPDAVIDEVASALTALRNDESLRARMGDRAKLHALQFSHEYRGRWFRSLHARLLGHEQQIDHSLAPADSFSINMPIAARSTAASPQEPLSA